MNSLPKTVTRQRRDCDLNPGPSAPESSTLSTRLGLRKLVLVEINGALYSNAYQYSSKLGHSLQCLFLCLLGTH